MCGGVLQIFRKGASRYGASSSQAHGRRMASIVAMAPERQRRFFQYIEIYELQKHLHAIIENPKADIYYHNQVQWVVQVLVLFLDSFSNIVMIINTRQIILI